MLLQALTRSVRNASLFAWTILLALATTRSASAEVSAVPELPAGWAVHYAQNMGVFQASADTWAPAAAFVLQENEAPHPEVRAAGFTATYRAKIAIPSDGTYRFAIEVDGGKADLRVRDEAKKSLLAECHAENGGRADSQWNKFSSTRDHDVTVEVVFERSGRGAARLRTSWEMAPDDTSGFRPEPIPAYVVRVPDADVTNALAGLVATRGRAMLEVKGCTQCHEPNETSAAAVGRRVGPDLSVTARFSRIEWLARWIRDPSSVRPHADMPSLLDGESDPNGVALDLAHFVKSLATERATAASWAFAPSIGRKIFHEIGCVACHGALASPREVFDDPQQSTTVPTADVVHPYGDLAGKWTRGALAEFLRDPAKLHRDGAMPSFLLSENDSHALADHLLASFESNARKAEEAKDESIVDAARVERGKQAFARLRCDACHGVLTPFGSKHDFAKDLGTIAANPAGGCLAGSGSTPRYRFGETAFVGDEGRALMAALPATTRATGIVAPTDRLYRTQTAAHCFSCHRKDTLYGVAPEVSIYFHSRDDRVDLGDEGRLPPDLTSVGFKLHTNWMKQVLRGEGIARPYMGVRMPSFAQLDTAAIATALSAELGTRPETDANPPATTDALVRDGQKLVGSTGMNCIGCHQFKNNPPVGSPGPRIDEFAGRLRYEWWTAYIQQPARFKPGTRMPSFALGRRSTVPGIQQGDIYSQGDALWAYFTLSENMPPPEGIAGKDALKIVVTDTPRVLRTFLERSGVRGIAVGLPVGIHYGFDAERVRLAEVWQGDFLDATGAWEGRGGTICGGQGKALWSGIDGPPLLVATAPPDTWPNTFGQKAGYRFLGYRFTSKDAPPTFRYSVNGVVVNERIDASLTPKPHFTRSFEIEGDPKALVVNPGGDGAHAQVRATSGFSVGKAGADWFQLTPETGAKSFRFEIEVTP